MSVSISPFFSKKNSPSSLNGSALLLSLFVMIVLMLLGTTLVNILNTSSETIAQEVIGTRALAAANSGTQAELQKLFPMTAGGSYCTPSDTAKYDFTSQAGLYHCKADTTCNNYANLKGVAYYRITSTGTCGTGAIDINAKDVVISSRTVQVEARSL